MLHLDLKPGNIMINNHDRLVLIDFGLSKRFDLWGNPETSTTIGHGTPGYAPVEQAHYQGNRNEGLPASMDIYALGATIFKMLTGQRPPEASIILNEGFPTDELVSVNTPVELIDVVHTCMEPMRKNRYKSMKEVIVALSTIPQMDEDSEWTELKQDIRGDLEKFLYKRTNRRPVILPVVMEVNQNRHRAMQKRNEKTQNDNKTNNTAKKSNSKRQTNNKKKENTKSKEK